MSFWVCTRFVDVCSLSSCPSIVSILKNESQKLITNALPGGCTPPVVRNILRLDTGAVKAVVKMLAKLCQHPFQMNDIPDAGPVLALQLSLPVASAIMMGPAVRKISWLFRPGAFRSSTVSRTLWKFRFTGSSNYQPSALSLGNLVNIPALIFSGSAPKYCVYAKLLVAM